MLRETVEKQPGLVKAVRGAYVEAVRMIKAGQDKDFFESKAKEFFNLSTPEQIAAGMKQNRQNFADLWGESFFESQKQNPAVRNLFGLTAEGQLEGPMGKMTGEGWQALQSVKRWALYRSSFE